MMKKLIVLLGLSMALASAKKCPTDKAEVKIFSCKDLASQKVAKSSKIKASHAKILHDAGYTKCLLPFGVLIVGNKNIENAGLLTTAKIVAELIDQDRNGVADNPSMVKKLRNKAYLVINKKESKLESKLSGFIPYYFEVDKFWHQNGVDIFKDYGKAERKKAKDGIRIEEVFHMFTQWAYGSQWPNLFATGNSNWTQSTLVKECRKAKCVWWQHPENNCPDQLAGVTANQKKCTAKDSCSGTCTSTNCDCVEWYHQVIMTSIGMTPAWRSTVRDKLGNNKTMPKTKAGMIAKLTSAMKELMSKKYNQPQKALKLDYPEVGKGKCNGTSTTTTTKPKTTTAKPKTTTAKPKTTTAKPKTTTAKPKTTTEDYGDHYGDDDDWWW